MVSGLKPRAETQHLHLQPTIPTIYPSSTVLPAPVKSQSVSEIPLNYTQALAFPI